MFELNVNHYNAKRSSALAARANTRRAHREHAQRTSRGRLGHGGGSAGDDRGVRLRFVREVAHGDLVAVVVAGDVQSDPAVVQLRIGAGELEAAKPVGHAAVPLRVVVAARSTAVSEFGVGI